MWQRIKHLLGSKWTMGFLAFLVAVGFIAAKKPELVKEVNGPWWVSVTSAFSLLWSWLHHRNKDE